MPFLLHDPAASELIGAAVVVMVGGEVVATYLGQARDGERRLLGSLAESVLLVRRRSPSSSQDRWTKWIVVLASRVGVFAALAIAALAPVVAGLGPAFGSWVSAAVALLVVFAGMLPRIRVEERALGHAFGAEYAAYASSTARVLPHVW